MRALRPRFAPKTARAKEGFEERPRAAAFPTSPPSAAHRVHVFLGMPHLHRIASGFALGGALVVALGSCRTTTESVGRTVTTAASAATPPPGSRTIDNAGWVDAAGRTSSETNRTELSGMRATEVGAERPTGTPGSGFSTDTARAVIGEKPSDRASTGAGIPKTDIVGRVVSAYCDRESVCDHVGDGKRWSRAQGCEEETRPAVLARIDATACERGVQASALAVCLTTLRDRACDDGRPAAELPECAADRLCLDVPR